MTPTRLVRAALAAALATGVLAACAQIPDAGSVNRVGGPESEQQEQVGFEPPGPAPGASPTQIVTGFIDAMQAIPPTTGFAEQFLTKEAATDWDPSRVVVYRGGYGTKTDGSAVYVTVKREATLSPRGVYRAVLPSERSDTHRYLLRQEDGEWRVTNPLNAFYISADTFARSYLPYSLYFIAPSGDALVPYPIYLPNGDQLATSLVQGVLDGPPAMPGQRKPVTAVPPGTAVDLSVSVTSDGVAEIRLDGPGLVDLTDVQRELLSAQLVWTVSQVSGVNGVRIFVDGVRWEIPGKPSVLDVGAFADFDPTERPESDTLYALEDGRLVYIETKLSDSGLILGTKVEPMDRSQWGQPQGIRSFDVSLGLDQVLAVSSSGTTMQIGKLYSSKGQVPDLVSNGGTAFFGTDLSQPVATRSKEWLVVDRRSVGSQLLAVSDDGKSVRPLASAPFRGQRIQSLALSPDGTRFAAIAQPIGRTGLGSPRLVLGQIRFADNGVSAVGVEGVHPLITTGDALRQVRSVSWIDATTLGVLGSVDRAAVAPYTVRIDGSNLLPEWILPVELGAPETLVSSVSEGGVYVRNAGGRLWFEADGEWKPVGRRPLSSPTFPG